MEQNQNLPITQPNHYELSGRNIHIVYSTAGVAGKPHFTYQDQQQTRDFSGEEIKVVETSAGTLVSVIFGPSVDVGHTFSVLMPRVSLSGGQPVHIQTFSISALHWFNPIPGQRDFYTVTRLTGNAAWVPAV